MEGNNTPTNTSSKMPLIIGGAILVILVGGGIGFFAFHKKAPATTAMKTQANAVTVSENEAGVKDLSNFKDTATGTLQKGGIKGEGTYHLDRPGGATQTVYLNSTVVDMSPFIGKKVQVWGQTQASQHAPWLMDVGKIQVVQ